MKTVCRNFQFRSKFSDVSEFDLSVFSDLDQIKKDEFQSNIRLSTKEEIIKKRVYKGLRMKIIYRHYQVKSKYIRNETGIYTCLDYNTDNQDDPTISIRLSNKEEIVKKLLSIASLNNRAVLRNNLTEYLEGLE